MRPVGLSRREGEITRCEKLYRSPFGIARQILDALMAKADGAGVKMLRLETGVVTHAALAKLMVVL
jgi:hypothetical protein